MCGEMNNTVESVTPLPERGLDRPLQRSQVLDIDGHIGTVTGQLLEALIARQTRRGFVCILLPCRRQRGLAHQEEACLELGEEELCYMRSNPFQPAVHDIDAALPEGQLAPRLGGHSDLLPARHPA